MHKRAGKMQSERVATVDRTIPSIATPGQTKLSLTFAEPSASLLNGETSSTRVAADSARRPRSTSQIVLNLAVWVLFTGLWIAFFVTPLFREGFLDETWSSLAALPVIGQLVVWLLFLPLMIGLWIWQATWPVVVRVGLISGIAWVNIVLFLPWKPWRTTS